MAPKWLVGRTNAVHSFNSQLSVLHSKPFLELFSPCRRFRKDLRVIWWGFTLQDSLLVSAQPWDVYSTKALLFIFPLLAPIHFSPTESCLQWLLPFSLKSTQSRLLLSPLHWTCFSQGHQWPPFCSIWRPVCVLFTVIHHTLVLESLPYLASRTLYFCTPTSSLISPFHSPLLTHPLSSTSLTLECP